MEYSRRKEFALFIFKQKICVQRGHNWWENTRPQKTFYNCMTASRATSALIFLAYVKSSIRSTFLFSFLISVYKEVYLK